MNDPSAGSPTGSVGLAFDLSLTDTEQQLLDAVSSLLERQGGLALVRATEDLGFSGALWSSLAALGVVDMTLPSAVGGGDEPLLTAALVTERIGRHIAPAPYVESLVAARLLANLSTPRSAELLAGITERAAIATIALRPPQGGVARWVPAGAVAEVVIALDGERLVAVSGAAPMEALANLGSSPLSHRDLRGAEELASGPHAVAAFRRARSEWDVLTACALAGASARALELTVSYAKERVAYGSPIAAYQAVAHRLADLATANSGLALLVRKAAWAVDHDPGAADALRHMALAFACEVAENTVTEGVHFHGGYGFTMEYDIQLYFRRVKSWVMLAGDPEDRLEALADCLWPAESHGNGAAA